jgi:hypothetical protein
MERPGTRNGRENVMEPERIEKYPLRRRILLKALIAFHWLLAGFAALVLCVVLVSYLTDLTKVDHSGTDAHVPFPWLFAGIPLVVAVESIVVVAVLDTLRRIADTLEKDKRPESAKSATLESTDRKE